MPIYRIHCLDCGEILDEYFPTINVTGWKCQKCGSDKKEKLVAGGVIFKLHNTKCGGFTNTSGKLK